MAKITRKPQTGLYPLPVVLVSCQSGGKPNIITLAWAGIFCSEPVLVGVGIRPERHSYGIIKESGDFVINMPRHGQIDLVDHCGLVSGREHDKFKECEFTPLPAEKIGAPLIKECPVNLECRVERIIPLGTHDLFLSEVVLAHYSEDCLVDGKFDLPAAEPLAYGFGQYFSLGEILGRHGRSALKKR